jgi:hypothetical protein
VARSGNVCCIKPAHVLGGAARPTKTRRGSTRSPQLRSGKAYLGKAVAVWCEWLDRARSQRLGGDLVAQPVLARLGSGEAVVVWS